MNAVTVVGAGLAGSEAAYQLAIRGIPVRLIEMKPKKMTPAHVSPYFAELVCSNSLRSDELTNAVGLLKEELRRLGSIVMRCADEHRVAAGGALAVDRYGFSKLVTEKIRSHPNITVVPGEVTAIPANYFLGGETLSYTVKIDDESVASASMDGSRLTVRGLKSGVTKASITASNNETQTFNITVRKSASGDGWL